MGILPEDFYIWYTIVVVGFVFVCAIAGGLFLNLVLGTPWYRYVISSAIIAAVANELVTFIGNVTLPPLRWFNDVPQNWQTAVWGRLEIIGLALSLLCFAIWQITRRSVRRILL
jgi:hypothetical protein